MEPVFKRDFESPVENSDLIKGKNHPDTFEDLCAF